MPIFGPPCICSENSNRAFGPHIGARLLGPTAVAVAAAGSSCYCLCGRLSFEYAFHSLHYCRRLLTHLLPCVPAKRRSGQAGWGGVLLSVASVRLPVCKTSSSAMAERPRELDQRFQGSQFEAKL